jgi:hypothetical protein
VLGSESQSGGRLWGDEDVRRRQPRREIVRVETLANVSVNQDTSEVFDQQPSKSLKASETIKSSTFVTFSIFREVELDQSG